MKAEFEETLKNKYPKILKLLNEPGREPISMFGIEVGDGWFSLIDEMCSQLEKLATEDVYFVQIKEKFGGLRAYLNWQTEAMDEAIRQAECESERTCEACGKPGTQNGGGWISTLCEDCRRS